MISDLIVLYLSRRNADEKRQSIVKTIKIRKVKRREPFSTVSFSRDTPTTRSIEAYESLDWKVL